MGCGTSKVLPEPPKNCYVDFVKSVVKCNNKQKLCDEEPLKPSGKKTDFWGIYNPGEYQQQQQQQQNQHLLWQEGVKRNKVAKYRAKFDSRVTARIIAKGSFTERDATQVLQMVLDGVKYLHSLGISHRDLKPENLLYYHPGTDSKILVTDFGLANSGNKGGDWSMRTTCGTPEYIAPEILLRKPYTSAVDMWALGVITYILLSGSMPFEDENRTRLYRMILKGKYSFVGDPWPSVSNLAKDYINRLLTVDPSERMTATQALKHPWIVTMAASSSMKNLHRSISQNLMRRASSRCQSSKSGQSSRSSRSRRIWEKEILERNLKYQPHYEQQ
ncbi:UNVERIFIED_CONTAM: hypothetical protein FKN15_043699 [Acipenser sinensis]